VKRVALGGVLADRNRKLRAREIGVPFAGTTGLNNAITDVADVMVGHTTLISGEGPLRVGAGPVRTGVTAILPTPPHRFVRAGFRSMATAR
jgi:L-aminopeptidase/D-esterase-like protein